MISIHAPRVGSDTLRCMYRPRRHNFNPRSPRGERRDADDYRSAEAFQSTLPAWGATRTASEMDADYVVFQSTLPAWGATLPGAGDGRAERFQSTLPAWGATAAFMSASTGASISIHAPRVGSDSQARQPGPHRSQFQSTLPAWGATHDVGRCGGADRTISIHAPRVGSDKALQRTELNRQYFNPRSPRGERRAGKKFVQALQEISIHAPRVGSDII